MMEGSANKRSDQRHSSASGSVSLHSTLGVASRGGTPGRMEPTNYNEGNIDIEAILAENRMLKSRVLEFAELRKSFTKSTRGKNATRKMKKDSSTEGDDANYTQIGRTMESGLWPYKKMMPVAWERWSENPKSISYRVMRSITVPYGYTRREYWDSIGVMVANDKLCNLRSNFMQGMKNTFNGEYDYYETIAPLLLLTVYC